MNTLKIYYHAIRGFLYSEKGWPNEPHYLDDAIDWKKYNKALQKAIEEAVSFDDQAKVRHYICSYLNNFSNDAVKFCQFYEIPFQKVEVIEVLSPGWVPTYNDPDNSGGHPNAEPMLVARLLPYTPDPEKEESQEELFRKVVELFNGQHKAYGRPDYQLLKEQFTVQRNDIDQPPTSG
jgi:hypothetical protein